MLRACAYIAAILYLLQEGACLEDEMSTNSTTEILSIVECFLETVDLPWQFSGEEHVDVANFYFFTDGACQKEQWRIFECYYPLLNQLTEATFLRGTSRQTELEFYKTENLEYYVNSTQLQIQAVQVLENLTLKMHHVKRIAAIKNETRILTDNCSRVIFDPELLKNKSELYVGEYEELQIKLQILQYRFYTKWYYMPPFIIVVLICGMLGNGLLLLIFARHCETRTGPNAVLVNLAVSDALFLFVNISLDYSKQLWGFPFGTNACYVYNFSLTLITGSSVYSMTMLSFNRYIAVTAKPGDKSHRFLTSTSLVVAVVWLLSSLVAIPDTLTATFAEEVLHNDCFADNLNLNSIPDFLFISFLPLIAISIFYIAASRRLRESAQNIPGEAIGQAKVKMARERGAKILPALAFVFAITYLPFYTFWMIKSVLKLNGDLSLTLHILYYFVYFFFNLNSTLNPIALYLASGMFRNHFNTYLTLGLRRKQTTPEKSANLKTDPTDSTTDKRCSK